MDHIVERELTPAKDVGLGPALVAYETGLPMGRDGKHREMVKAAADRSMEVMHPFLLQAERIGKERIVNLGDDGWNYTSVDSGNPWRPAVFVRAPSGFGYLCAFELDVRPSDEALAAFDPNYVPHAGGRLGIEGNRARTTIEKRIVAAGFLTGMPDPASITKIKGASVHVVRPDREQVRDEVGLQPAKLGETLTAIANDDYSGGRVIRFMPDGRRMKQGAECTLTTRVLDALSALGRAAYHAAGHEAFKARNEEVGSRAVKTLSDRPWEIALLEAAAAAVYRDGGAPDVTTYSAVNRAWLHDTARGVGRMAGELRQARAILEDQGHVSYEQAYGCNNDGTKMWVQDGPDGAKLAFVGDKGGLYVVRETQDDEGASISMARVGESSLNAAKGPVDLTQGFLGRFRVDGQGTAVPEAAGTC